METYASDFIHLLPDDTTRRLTVLFDRFRDDLDSALQRADKEYSQHMQSKGEVCEAAIRKYLSETLGNRYGVTDGLIFDAKGKQSKQQDVIIFDDHWSIRLTPKDSGEPALIPVESVYTTIEVKKTLSSSDLSEAIENVRSFKSLERAPVGPEYVTSNKQIANLGTPGEVRNPYYSAIFAFTANRSMEAVVDQLKREVSAVPPMEWPDAVVVHNEGIILPFCVTCSTPQKYIRHTYVGKIVAEGHTPDYILDRLGREYSLLGFHLQLMRHLHYTILGPLEFIDMYSKLSYVARTKTT